MHHAAVVIRGAKRIDSLTTVLVEVVCHTYEDIVYKCQVSRVPGVFLEGCSEEPPV